MAAAPTSERPWFDVQQIDTQGYLRKKNGTILEEDALIKILYGSFAPNAEEIPLEAPDDLDEYIEEEMEGPACLVTQRDLELAHEERAEVRPANTTRSYGPRVKQFVNWCRDHGVRPIPHAERCAAFIHWRRSNRIGQAKKLTLSTLTMNIQALQDAKKRLEDLCNIQLGKDLNEEGLIKSIKDAMPRREADRRKREYVDPHRGTVSDMLDEDNMIQILKILLAKGKDKIAIRYWSMIVVARQAMYRGDDQRVARLCDLFINVLPRSAIGPDRCIVLNIISYQGKRNQMGRPEYGFMMRHRDPQLCGILATAIHLFMRFEISHEDAPDLVDSSKWYDILLWPARGDVTQELSDAAHREYIGNVFKQIAGLVISKILHAFRPSGANAAAMAGATSDDVQRAGRWAAAGRNASLWLSYLGSFCSSVALALAGFTLDTQKYCLPRSCLNPPAELQQTIFPWLEEKEAAVKEANAEKNPREKLIASQRFCELLHELRVVLLQDCAFFDHPVFSEPVFHTPPCRAWKRQLQAEAATHAMRQQLVAGYGSEEAVKHNVAMAQGFETVLDKLDMVEESFLKLLQEKGDTLTDEAARQAGLELAEQLEATPELVRRSRPATILDEADLPARQLFPSSSAPNNPEESTALVYRPAAATQEVAAAATQEVAAAANQHVAAAQVQPARGGPSAQVPAAPPLPPARAGLPPAMRQLIAQYGRIQGLASTVLSAAAGMSTAAGTLAVAPATPPAAASEADAGNVETRLDTYFLKETPQSASDVWNEFFHHGPGAGQAQKPPIVRLMAKYGEQKWYHDPKSDRGQNNRKNAWNKRNKPIVLEILDRVQHGQTADLAVRELDSVRESLRHKSVDGLAKHLSEEQKEKGAAWRAAAQALLLRQVHLSTTPERLAAPAQAGGKRRRAA